MLQHRSDRLANTSPREVRRNASSRRVVERLETAFAAARTNTRHIDYTVYTTPYQGSPPNEHPELILPPRSKKQFTANTTSSFLVERHRNCSLHQSASKLKYISLLNPAEPVPGRRLALTRWQYQIPGTPAPGSTKNKPSQQRRLRRRPYKHQACSTAREHVSLAPAATSKNAKKEKRFPALPRAEHGDTPGTRCHRSPPR
jgi:hypothetical protein